MSYTNLLYSIAVQNRARIIVELGVGEGHSTLALLKAAIKNNGHLFSVDLQPCKKAHKRVDDSELDKSFWTFIQMDSLEWSKPPPIDLLFIDSSHFRSHTLKELKVHSPHVVVDGVILLHDTLLTPERSPEGWNVKGAIEDFLRVSDGWEFLELLPDDPGGCGLGLLRRKIRGIVRTKEVNINTVQYWNKLCASHGGGERDDPERFKPMARKAFGSALDIGCFFGHLCKYLYERGCEPVVGVDFSVEAIKRAKKNYPFCEFVVAEAAYLPFRDSSFDSVTLAETLEHLTDYREGLREAERVGRKIIFSVPDSSVYTEHVWTFTEEGVENLVKRRGGYVEELAGKWLMGWYRSDT